MSGTFSPSPFINGAVGSPFSLTISYSHFDGHEMAVNVGITRSYVPGSPYLSNGDPAGPLGVSVSAPSGNPSSTKTITISGNPTTAGQYFVYLMGKWNDGTDHIEGLTYTITISGPALTTVPASGTVTPSAQQGQGYASGAFVIQNGSGNYTLTLTGAPASIGLGSNATPSTGVNSLTISSNTFYLVNKSSGTPTSGEVGSSSITIRVHDNITGAVNFVPTFTFIVASAGGTLSIVESGSASCTQEKPFSRTYTVSGGAGGYIFSLIGATPVGLTALQTGPTTGVISGTPNGAVTNTGGNLYSFTAHVEDSAHNTGSLPINLTVLPGADYYVDGGGSVPSTCPINTAYPTTILTAIGGDGIVGNYQWQISHQLGAGAIQPGLPTGMDVNQGGPHGEPYGQIVGNYKIIQGVYVTFQGAPNQAGSYTIFATPYSPVGASLFAGSQARFPLTVSGASDLTIGPIDLTPGWVQNTNLSIPISAIGGGGGDAYAWVVSGLPSGITCSGGTSSTTNLTGGSAVYGTYSVPVSVTDSTQGKTGAKTYTLVVAPDIWVNSGLTSGHLTAGVKGSTYNDVVVFMGGDNTGFTYTVGVLPGGITYTPSGTGNNTLTFHADAITAVANTYTISVNVTVKTVNAGGTRSKLFNIPITITGGGQVTLVPFAAALCAGNSAISGVPKVKICATVTGGTTNQYTITPPSGWFNNGFANDPGPFSSNNDGGTSFITYTQSGGNVPGSYTFTLTSTEDGTASRPVVVTVYAGPSSDPSITPSSGNNGGLGYNMYSGDSKQFVASMPGTCSTSHGLWTFFGGGVPAGVTFNPPSQRGGNITVVVAPGAITVPQTLTLNYQPDEDPDRFAQVFINLVPGASSSNFYISTASLSTGAVTVAYSQALTTSGGTTPALYSRPGGVTGGALPSPFILTSAGVISGTPTISSNNVFTVTAKDSSATPVWTSKTFALTVTSGGGLPTITSLTPSFGPVGGGTSIDVLGTNFLAGDIFSFAYTSGGTLQPGPGGFKGVGGGTTTWVNATTVVASATHLTVTSPAWSHGAGTVDVAVIRGGNNATTKSSAFTYGGATFSVGTFSPAFATVNDPDKVIHVYGSNFDSSCSIKFTRRDGGGEQSLSAQLFNSSTDISGTVLAANFTSGHAGTTAEIKVVASDGSSFVSPTTFSINGTNLDITTASLANATRGGSYSQALAASGGVSPYTWAIAPGSGVQPPTGITLSSDGHLTATTVDSAATSSTPTFEVTDSIGNKKDKAIQITVVGGNLTITTVSPLPNANVGSLYGNYIVASGGIVPYIFTKASGALPLGLNLDTDGNLHGTPTTGNSAPSDFSFSVQVEDSTPVTTLKKVAVFSLHLDPAISTITIDSLNPAAGPVTGGISVTITGTGFRNGCTVQFGAIAATAVQFVSGTSVIATAPPGAEGAVTISVRNPDGGNGVYSSFLYQVLSFPLITNIDKLDGPFAGGQTVILSGSNFQGISAIQFISANNVAIAASFDPSNVSLSSSPQTAIITTPPGFTFGDGAVAVGVTISVTNASGTGTWPLGSNGYMYRPPPIITGVVPNTGPTSGGQTVYVIGSNFFQRGAVKPRVFIGNVEVPASSITLKEQ